MSSWLLDASVLLAALDARDPEHAPSQSLLAGAAPVKTLDLAGYEAVNVAIRAWRSPPLAFAVRAILAAIEDDGGMVRADDRLLSLTERLADVHGLSGYDAAYVAGADITGARLVSCDVRDLVEPGLAVTPQLALGD